MGNRLLAAKQPGEEAGADSIAYSTKKGAIPAPTFNNLLEMLDLAALEDNTVTKWFWLDENGRETLSCSSVVFDRRLLAYPPLRSLVQSIFHLRPCICRSESEIVVHESFLPFFLTLR